MNSNKMNEFIEYLKSIGFSDYLFIRDNYFKLDDGKILILGNQNFMKVCNYKINLIYGVYGGMRYHNTLDELDFYTSEIEYIQSEDCFNDYVKVQSDDYIEEPDYNDESTRMNHDSPIEGLYFKLDQ